MDDEFALELAQTNQPAAVFGAVAERVDAEIGAKLFTLTTIDLNEGYAHRCFTNRPVEYPPSGKKPITPNSWTKVVVDRHDIFRANTIDEIAKVFPDHDLINSLGCQSCVNIPIIVAGNLIGTMNCLHQAHHYTQVPDAKLRQLGLYGALAFLTMMYCKQLSADTQKSS